jgi:nuclear pore complex protein Nup155
MKCTNLKYVNSELYILFVFLHYACEIPPFNDQENIQAVSADIAVLLNDWLEEAKRAQSSIRQEELPVGRIDAAVDQYMKELNVTQMPDTMAIYEGIRRNLRRSW